jgi:hypothetical protein
MPRVGGADFAARYPLAGATYRLVHGEDIVPSVPPSKLGFRHVGCLLRAPRGGVFEGAPLAAGGDDPPFAASLVEGSRPRYPRSGAAGPSRQYAPVRSVNTRVSCRRATAIICRIAIAGRSIARPDARYGRLISSAPMRRW